MRMVKVIFGALGEGLSMSDMVEIVDGLLVDDGMRVLGWKDQNEEDALRRFVRIYRQSFIRFPFTSWHVILH